MSQTLDDFLRRHTGEGFVHTISDGGVHTVTGPDPYVTVTASGEDAVEALAAKLEEQERAYRSRPRKQPKPKAKAAKSEEKSE